LPNKVRRINCPSTRADTLFAPEHADTLTDGELTG
jgi:hypothetical protein